MREATDLRHCHYICVPSCYTLQHLTPALRSCSTFWRYQGALGSGNPSLSCSCHGAALSHLGKGSQCRGGLGPTKRDYGPQRGLPPTLRGLWPTKRDYSTPNGIMAHKRGLWTPKAHPHVFAGERKRSRTEPRQGEQTVPSASWR